MLFLLFTLLTFVISYFAWAGFIERKLGILRKRMTPAHELYDGVDYVPTRFPILFGHHFASIAGAGPILGPVLAIQFGWLPAFLWIMIGTIFLGAVHDFGSLLASVRHKGKLIGEVISEYLSRRAKMVFCAFATGALILVIAVFARVVAGAFAQSPQAASAAVSLTVFSLALGFMNQRLKLPTYIIVAVTVVFCFVAVLIGMEFPLSLSFKTWFAILAIYSFIASVLPVWALLQPRDFTNFFLLLAFLIMGVAGVLISRPEFKVPAFTSFNTNLGYLFPIMFVTVACGAISGFHSLVSSGTTSKQISSETHARPIGYGGMLLEGVLAIIALFAAGIFAFPEYMKILGPRGDGAITVFSIGMTKLSVGVPPDFVRNFSTLALSAFALTSLDTSARITRYMLQEMSRKLESRYVSSGLAVGGAVILAISGGAGILWPLFGSSNQLLAAIALLAISVWLSKAKIEGKLFFLIPSAVMFIITLSAMLVQVVKFTSAGNVILSLLSITLLALAIFFLIRGISGTKF